MHKMNSPTLQWMRLYWKYIVLLVTPIVYSPIPIYNSASLAARCGYVVIIMAKYWMTEAIPMAVTALIPVFAFPLLGILSTGDTCLAYMKPTNMMFLGGLMVAIAIEHCNLHRRIALFVILHVGQSPKRLMAGFMLTTMFLSMWISNTATTAMMVPIVNAILLELYPSKEKDIKTEGEEITENLDHNQVEMGVKVKENEIKGIENGGFVSEITRRSSTSSTDKIPDSEVEMHSIQKVEETAPAVDENESPNDNQRRMMGRALFLGVAYSANIGGTGVVTGTTPNLVMMALLASSFSEPTGMNFATWIAFNVPGMLICIFIAWIWLQILFMGLFRKKSVINKSTRESEAAVRDLISRKYKELGRMTQHEITVLCFFLLLVCLWFFRNPEFIPGWISAFTHDKKIGDATPAMLIVFLLFAFPTKFNLPCMKSTNDKLERPVSCMSWNVVQEKVPWSVVLLLGGGFAIAEASKTSGLSAWLGIQFELLQILPKEAIVLVVCLLTAMLTEVASNTATASVLLPVLKEMALNINVNPLYLMLPATICCSYAFMLPVATAPNAIVFSAANMKSSDMMKAGFVMNIMCVLVITVMINTLGVPMFDLYNMPSWTNSTTV